MVTEEKGEQVEGGGGEGGGGIRTGAFDLVAEKPLRAAVGPWSEAGESRREAKEAAGLPMTPGTIKGDMEKRVSSAIASWFRVTSSLSSPSSSLVALEEAMAAGSSSMTAMAIAVAEGE